jgi:hypothetical protein
MEEPLSSFKYVRLYTGSDGETHMEDVELELTDSGRGTDVSPEFEAGGVNFAKFRDDYSFDQHNAPRRRFVIMLSGSIEVEASDGQVRTLGPGTALLAEDLTGVGHKSRIVGSGERLSVFVQLSPM